MNIAIYHPLLHNFGGGEMVALHTARIAARYGTTHIITHTPVRKATLEKFFGLSLDGISIEQMPTPLRSIPGGDQFKLAMQMRYAMRSIERRYDVVIDTATNGWFHRSLRIPSICYIHYPQFPAPKKGWKRIVSPLIPSAQRSFHYDVMLCNSHFTAQSCPKDTHVVYPPVMVEAIHPQKAKKRIISVGRISPEKKHEILIETFKQSNLSDYTLEIIGAYHSDNPLYPAAYLEKLKALQSHTVSITLNMDHHTVLERLAEASVYWHARGYGEQDPAQYENFGITTVEAMAAGCIPVVINKGAQPEIVRHGTDGFCWDTPQQLIEYTHKAIKSTKMRQQVIQRAHEFSVDKFIQSMEYHIAPLLRLGNS